MKKYLLSYKAYTSAFALIIFVMIIVSCTTYASIISKQILIIDNLKEIRENLLKEYEMLVTFDHLLKEYEFEEEIIDDGQGNEEIVIVDDKIVIDDYYISFGLVNVINEDSYYILNIDDISVKVYGDIKGIESFSY